MLLIVLAYLKLQCKCVNQVIAYDIMVSTNQERVGICNDRSTNFLNWVDLNYQYDHESLDHHSNNISIFLFLHWHRTIFPYCLPRIFQVYLCSGTYHNESLLVILIQRVTHIKLPSEMQGFLQEKKVKHYINNHSENFCIYEVSFMIQTLALYFANSIHWIEQFI